MLLARALVTVSVRNTIPVKILNVTDKVIYVPKEFKLEELTPANHSLTVNHMKSASTTYRDARVYQCYNVNAEISTFVTSCNPMRLMFVAMNMILKVHMNQMTIVMPFLIQVKCVVILS